MPRRAAEAPSHATTLNYIVADTFEGGAATMEPIADELFAL